VDIIEAPDLSEAVQLCKRYRELIHTASSSAPTTRPSAYVHGVVGDSEAIFAFVQLTTSALETPGPSGSPGYPGRSRHALNAPSYADKQRPA